MLITKINELACASAHSYNYSKLECIVLFVNLEAALEIVWIV